MPASCNAVPRARKLTPGKIVKLIILCAFATGCNFLLNTLICEVFLLPLFLDTLFTCAVCFAAGPIPGILTGILTAVLIVLRTEQVTTYYYILCSIAEVLLIWSFCRSWAENTEPESASPISKIAILLLVFITDSGMLSVLGGIIDFVIHVVLLQKNILFSPEDAFKLGLLRNNVPLLAADVLSRIPINIVDRFIVIFGGYFLAQPVKKFLRGKRPVR
ncbi:hypothetical protein TREPR_3167 [Treponema primitia ZAS-2]|uniref:ECF transporter S component n=1 Tax=Treponema primitia (strain ATCC BAA-887 / DSM 12427 / ZAS-2) TaxID=545694 RepID=F5YLR3_TREPZ|nr:hypothetical protein [Treponema primitia]AEF83732.1 hypothetical protein TREPR_3167 [Treponema primitia ZAS-2]